MPVSTPLSLLVLYYDEAGILTENGANMTNNKEEIPLGHYTAQFAKLDPAAVAARTGLPWDGERRVFTARLMGAEYAIGHPDGAVVPDTMRANERILLLRYLCEGKFKPAAGQRYSYHEVPWGNAYFRQFEGRVLNRAAYTFSGAIENFRQKVEASGIPSERISQSDAGYRFLFLDGFWVTLMLYAEDEDFPPSAQMLFDDNFIGAFTAEDMAVIGEIVIQRLKSL
jgi:hypothetical protein